MALSHVHVSYDVFCDWKDAPPVYRLWVNNELFAERTYRWQDEYLQEEFVISAPPGKYSIRYELIGQGRLVVKNPNVIKGPGKFTSKTMLRIDHENA